MAEERDDFYVGYLPKAPPGIARHLRWTVVGLVLVTAAVALALVFAQRPFPASTFEFGVYREYEGRLREHPYPALVVLRPGGRGAFSTYPLVRFGKHGAGEEVAGLDGERVRLRAALIFREDQKMLEIEEGSIEALGPDRPPGAVVEALGRHRLRGEIVDSKCYLGVMKPGHGKPHRACAVRCISGGIPPVLVLRDGQGFGPAAYLWVEGPEGRPIHDRLLDRVAEPLVVEGEVFRHGDRLILRAEPAAFRRPEPGEPRP